MATFDAANPDMQPSMRLADGPNPGEKEQDWNFLQ
jgi:hypothetical protein